VALRHRRVRLLLRRRQAPRHGPRLQCRPERGRRRRLVDDVLALALPEEGVGGGAGGRGGGAGEDGGLGARAGGREDGGLGLAEQPLDGLAVGLEPQLAGELEHARRAHDRHPHAPPTSVHLAVPVLAAARARFLRRGHHGVGGRERRQRHWSWRGQGSVDLEGGGGVFARGHGSAGTRRCVLVDRVVASWGGGDGDR
jgi:hypothetical protein